MAKIVSRGDPIEPVYLNNLIVAARGWGVVSGLATSQRGAGANMSVDVAAGDAWINSVEVTKGLTTNIAITAAHATYDRYDLVVINSSGTISVIDGTAAATSYANDYDLETNNAILLAEVYVPATDTTIENAQITDKIILLDILPSLIYPCLEEYSNHLGAVDNFTETTTVGNGSASADATNHEMDLSSGITIVGCAAFKTKDAFLVGSNPLIFSGKIQNIINGAVGTRYTKVGFADNWTTITAADEAVFQYISTTPEWVALSRDTGSGQTTSLSDIVDGDVLTIVLTNSKVIFYVNGIVVATHVSKIPAGSVNIGFGVFCASSGVATPISCSVDMLGVKHYL